MGSTTPIHGLRYPVGGDPASGLASNFYSLASDVDNSLPVVSTSTPTPKSGLLWYNPSTGQQQISDGTSWYNVIPQLVSSGTVLAGTQSTSKPYNTLVKRQSGSTDTNGLIAVSLSGVTCLLYPIGQLETGGTSLNHLMLRYDLCSTSQAVWQMWNAAGSAVAVSATYIIGAVIIYQ